jgi:DNA-binding response OmpR family regulator
MTSSTILLVDDEKAITDNLAPFLERAGFRVSVAHDGDTALPAPAYDTDWSPDGRWIAAIDLGDRECLALMDVERLEAEPVISR